MSSNKARVMQLDFLRGLAILLVLLRHPIVEPHDSGHLLPLAGLVHHLGWTGVDLFFVLSGFLVGGLLFDELRKHGRLDIRRFIIRRGFKIWPPYFVYLFLVFFILVFDDPAHRWGVAGEQLTANLLHLQNYLGSPRAHTWSLAVEEHFYLVLPFVIMLCLPKGEASSDSARKRGLPRLPVIAVTVMAACLAVRVLFNLPRPFTEHTHYFATHVRVDSMFFGVLLAYLYHYQFLKLDWVAARRRTFLVVGLLLISPMAVFGLRQPFVWTVGYTCLYLGYGAIVLAVLSTPVGEGPLGKVLQSAPAKLLSWVGFFSYSIYLWHLDVVPRLARLLLDFGFANAGAEVRYLVGVVLYAPGAVLMGVGMAKLVEGPSLKLRDRLFPGRSQGLSSEQSVPSGQVVSAEPAQLAATGAEAP